MDNEAKVWLQEVWYFVENWGTITYEGEDREGLLKIGSDDDIILEDGEGDGDGDGDGNGGGGGDETIEDSSIILIFGAVTLVLVGAFYFLRGEA